MAQIKINNIIYGSSNASDIIYKNITIEEKLDTIPIFDPSDNINIENAKYDYLTYGHIYDGLNSSDTSKALSANQGRILSNRITENTNNISDINIDISNNKSLIDSNTNNIINIDNKLSTIQITDLITSTKDCTITNSTFVKTGNVIQIYMTVAINPSISQFTMDINNKYSPLLDYGILSVRKMLSPYIEIGTGWVYSAGRFGFYINQNGSINSCYINGVYIAKS